MVLCVPMQTEVWSLYSLPRIWPVAKQELFRLVCVVIVSCGLKRWVLGQVHVTLPHRLFSGLIRVKHIWLVDAAELSRLVVIIVVSVRLIVLESTIIWWHAEHLLRPLIFTQHGKSTLNHALLDTVHIFRSRIAIGDWLLIVLVARTCNSEGVFYIVLWGLHKVLFGCPSI